MRTKSGHDRAKTFPAPWEPKLHAPLIHPGLLCATHSKGWLHGRGSADTIVLKGERGQTHSRFDALNHADDFMKASIRYLVTTLLWSALVLFQGIGAAAQSTNRGIWCWATPGPYGLNHIIGTNALQDAAVAQFKAWGITHVYGFYGTQLKTVPGQTALAAWNTLLNKNGIDSQLLISDYTLGTGDNAIILQMIDFNKNQPAAARFKGVHLDIEPWGMPSWPTDNQY